MARTLAGVALFFVAIFASAGTTLAEDTAPMLGQPPYPEGYVRPVPRPAAALIVEGDPANPAAFCAYLDVGANGSVSNVHTILSTGSKTNDIVLIKWLEGRRYIPATLNGTPIKVRILFGFSTGQQPPEKANYCRWDMYHPES